MTKSVVKSVSVALSACLFLTACGGSASSLSSANPFNWFSGKDRAAEAAATAELPTDPRALIPQITDVKTERATGGVILRVTGLPAQQGWSQAALVPQNEGIARDGVLSFEFRALPPRVRTLTSTPQSREVVVATFLSDSQLSGVRSIQVLGASRSLSVRP